MNFNIEETMDAMTGAVLKVVKKDTAKMKGYAKQVLEGHKEALDEIAKLRIKGEITDEDMHAEIEDEKDTFEAELSALNVMTKAMAQKAANAAIDVFCKAVEAAL